MILLMAGTSEGRELATFLQSKGYPLIVSTVSDYGASLLSEGIKVISRPLSKEDIVSLISEAQISVLLDATHPFAVNASNNGQMAARETQITYLRWEREGINDLCSGEVLRVKDAQEAVKILESYQRILLTIGSKELTLYQPLLKNPDKQVYVRVLPLPASLQICWDLGLSPGQIIASQGPFSKDWNLAMIRQLRVQVLVTKESGRRGGVEEKLQAAREANISVVLIERPELEYSQQVRSYQELEIILPKKVRVRKIYNIVSTKYVNNSTKLL